jgi:pilus assembly protein FimV
VDESETKLDLAAAYIDMGDPEGAKSILEEVLLEGNDEQKSRAQTLMTELN